MFFSEKPPMNTRGVGVVMSEQIITFIRLSSGHGQSTEDRISYAKIIQHCTFWSLSNDTKHRLFQTHDSMPLKYSFYSQGFHSHVYSKGRHQTAEICTYISLHSHTKYRAKNFLVWRLGLSFSMYSKRPM